ncbi:MAG: ABC transporter ATP-binding protein [Rhodobacteraceae bacterium]|nr:ABC transporter ATP-binding protein [Paracoccaceae bacterium]
MTDQQQPLLEVERLSVTYGQVQAVREISLQVLPGEFVSIIGNNGAGKSSTLKAIAGVVKPAGGTIRIQGTEVQGLPAHRIVRMGLSLVPEGRQVFADQTVDDNLRLGAYSRRRDRESAVDADIERMVELFPVLGERRTQVAGSLSGGEQQMLALARGLLSRPRLLMIDEMSLGLAPRVLETLFPVLERLNRDGLAILLVEQLATMALRVAHRGYVFENAEISISGSARSLAQNRQVIESYLGRRAV